MGRIPVVFPCPSIGWNISFCLFVLLVFCLPHFGLGGNTVCTRYSLGGNIVYRGNLTFGMPAAFNGSAGFLGELFLSGLEMAFFEVNCLYGGLGGYHLQIITKNDQYLPTLTASYTEELITQDDVFAIIGTVGAYQSQGLSSLSFLSSRPYIRISSE